MPLRSTFALAVAACLTLLASAPAPAHGEEDGEDRVQARLLSEASTLPAGGSVLVGVALDIAPGWYVYWKSPGEAGMRTRVRFEVPEGFEVEDVRWPVPERRVQDGGVSYVHEGQFTLLATLRVPAGLEPGRPVTLRARLDWLVCRDACYMISRDVALTLDVSEPGPAPKGADAARLQAAQRALPGQGAPEGLRTTWRSAPVVAGDGAQAAADVRQALTLEVPGADALAFYAWQPEDLVLEDMARRGRVEGPRLELIYPGRVRGKTVTGVLAITRGDATEHFELTLPGPEVPVGGK